MAFKKGSKVIITKNLGPKNKADRGNSEDYYFPNAENINEIPLGSEGTIVRVDGNKIFVRIKKTDNEYPFHKNELKFFGQTTDNNQLDKLPQPYVFSLASQMPLFLINDRMYVLDDVRSDLKSDFFQTSSDGRVARRRLVESATLSSLEELTQAHHAKDFDKIERKYLQEIIEERSERTTTDDERYRLIDFIVNEVFPYFRRNEQDSTKLGKILGVKVVANEKAKIRACRPEESQKEDAFVSRLIGKIEKETFSFDKRKVKKIMKLDTLLGYELDPDYDASKLPQDYNPCSLLGKVLEGRNVAIIDGTVYNLAQTNDPSHEDVLNFAGRNFTPVSPRPVSEVRARYDFELSKKIRTESLKTKLAQDRRLQELNEKDSTLKKLIRKKEYWEGDFGFIRNSYEDDNELSYYVFLQVPKHVLKMPDDYELDEEDYDDEDEKGRRRKRKDRFYLFGKVRVAVSVYSDGSDISYDNEPVTIERYDHPFTSSNERFGGICLGTYNFYKLNKLKRGEAIAKLLTDTRTTLMSGYTSRYTQAQQHLEDFDDNMITPYEIKKRNLPVTNINLGKGRRRR